MKERKKGREGGRESIGARWDGCRGMMNGGVEVIEMGMEVKGVYWG